MDKIEWFCVEACGSESDKTAWKSPICGCCIDTITPEIKLVIDMMMDSLDRTKFKYVHNFEFPYWSKKPNGELSNLYISYNPPKHHWWKRMMLYFGWADDTVAVHIKDRQLYVLSQINAGLAYRTHAFSLADPDCFLKIGKHIVKSIT